MSFQLHIPMHRRRRDCRGLSVLEVTAALLIVAFAMTGLTQMLSLSAAQRRASETRRLAQEEVANQAERIALLAWDETTEERLTAQEISEGLRTLLPSAKLSLALTEEAGPPLARRIDIAVVWVAADGEVDPVRLTVWKHQPAEARP
jgi:hypothetical protein